MNKLIIFDMDDTLYTSPELKRTFTRSVNLCVANKLNLTLIEAMEHFKSTREKAKNATGIMPGRTTTLYTYYGVSIKEFEDYKLELIEGSKLPQINTPELNNELGVLLKKISQKYNTAVFTNNHKSLTEMILNEIGIFDIFNRIYTLNDMPDELLTKRKKTDQSLNETDEKILSYIKPSKTRLKSIMSDFNLTPESCISVGDRYHIDHIYAKEMGMQTVLVNGVEDVIRYLAELMK